MNLQHLSTHRPWLRGETPCLPCEPSQLPAFTLTQIRIWLFTFDADPDPPASQTGRRSIYADPDAQLKDPSAKKERELTGISKIRELKRRVNLLSISKIREQKRRGNLLSISKIRELKKARELTKHFKDPRSKKGEGTY
jgi:hypothetical protein